MFPDYIIFWITIFQIVSFELIYLVVREHNILIALHLICIKYIFVVNKPILHCQRLQKQFTTYFGKSFFRSILQKNFSMLSNQIRETLIQWFGSIKHIMIQNNETSRPKTIQQQCITLIRYSLIYVGYNKNSLILSYSLCLNPCSFQDKIC